LAQEKSWPRPELTPLALPSVFRYFPPAVVESFTIITTEPNELVRPIHNRMPVILRSEAEEQWLDVSRTSFVKAKSLLKPYPEQLMDAHDVSTIVNSAKYDGPDCIRPVLDDEIPRAAQLSLL
jgi:putative SOS response-associated peptidase YedK